MKAKIVLAALACLALLTACDKETVPHTGDETGALYGIWKLEKKTEAIPQSDGGQSIVETDYSKVNFYLVLSDLAVPTALATKGSLKDLDVDGTLFTYNANLKQISFREKLWLTEFPSYSMELNGTFDVRELTDKVLVISQKSLLGITSTYAYKKYNQYQ